MQLYDLLLFNIHKVCGVNSKLKETLCFIIEANTLKRSFYCEDVDVFFFII